MNTLRMCVQKSLAYQSMTKITGKHMDGARVNSLMCKRVKERTGQSMSLRMNAPLNLSTHMLIGGAHKLIDEFTHERTA